ncbi:hypothetical protein LPJ64_000329 [Coemansia asiatica]|uniref:Succinylglutamate desuccinylase/Aspartoacylase catalytic domain-containing protein n=1 Tax=Coemansia asiatica TaxID=1052880 RepID=A0A9W7XS21_9FUNG|nr:hypothetical protein LPJ64_000329 [Coemansia asiatica]
MFPANGAQILVQNGSKDTSLDKFHTLFFEQCTKVDARYQEHCNDSCDKLAALEAKWTPGMPEDELKSWKADFTSLITELEILSDFAQTNVMASRRILEKADAVLGQSVAQEIWPQVSKLPFASLTIDELPLHRARAIWRKCTAVPVFQGTLVDAEPKTHAQRIVQPIPTVAELDLDSFPVGKISRVWIALAEDGMGLPIRVPVMVAKGALQGPVVGITAALHGNELNGIPLTHRLFKDLDPQTLHGTLVAVPVANSPGYLLSQRGYSDGSDLNRLMPGKPDASGPQVYAYNLMQRIVRHFEYLIDLHTASCGRINSLYVRTNLRDPRTARMARLQNPQIIVHNTSPGGSLRGAAMDLGIPAITVEIGDPSTFNEIYVKNALIGVTNILSQMTMLPDQETPTDYEPVVCSRSYWIFAKSGGILTVYPELATWVRAGDLIATVHNVFGDVEEEYYAPQDGVIVGKHIDPVCQTGNRILHLGVVDGELQAIVDDGHM